MYFIEKMFFVSFIIFCVIFSVIAVQSMNATAIVTTTVTKSSSQSDKNFYSDAGTIRKPNGNETDSMVKLSEKSLNGSEAVKHNRKVTKTDTPPNIAPNGITKNTLTINDRSAAAVKSNPSEYQSKTVSNIEQPVAVKKIVAEQKPVVTQKSTGAAVNNQTKNENSKLNSSSVSTSSSTLTSTTIATTTTTTTTPKPTTTTTPVPKKPLITFSVEDVPGLSKAAEAQTQAQPKLPVQEEPESLQSSEMMTYPEQKSTHNFVMSMIGIIVVFPFIVIVTNCAVRQVRDYWSKRRYRRMDYLIEDMYN